MRSHGGAEPADDLRNYRDGRAFVTHLAIAAVATLDHRTGDANQHADAADKLLRPLGELTEPEDLRDFIAGAAAEAERRIAMLAMLAELVDPIVRQNL